MSLRFRPWVWLAAVVLGSTSCRKPATPAADPLLVYCAAGLRAPVEELARDFERETGVKIELQFGGSQTLLANLTVSQRGDLFLPADSSYVAAAKSKNLAGEELPLARMSAVLAVAKGNPKNLHTLAGLLDSDVKIVQANPDAAAIGKLTRDALDAAGQWDALAKRTLVFKPTVNDAANDVKLGAADAGIIWDAVAKSYPELDSVGLPELAGVRANVTASVLASSRQSAVALRFARFLAARDRGAPVFRKFGFEATGGDPWTAVPELRLLAGAMLRPALEVTLSDFENREGCRVTRIYNGCGILVAQMKAGERPDAYFACDTSFMVQVSDLFLDAREVSTNQLVMLVPKGNPKNLRILRDLAQPGLRVGIGHEKQCALGVLTKKTFETVGVADAVAKNIAVQAPTGDLLVNQLRAGSLDAAVTYVSNATGAADKLDAIAIDLPCAIAAQPLAVGRESRFPQLAARLAAALLSPESKARFVVQGFQWTAE